MMQVFDTKDKALIDANSHQGIGLTQKDVLDCINRSNLLLIVR